MPFDHIRPEHELPHEETIGSRRVYESRYMNLRVDDVILPSGRRSDRHVVERSPSVVIIPVTTDDHVLFIRQFRYAAGKRLIELPAGMIDPGEDVVQTASRELLEETAHQAGSLQVLGSVYLSPGFTDEQCSFVLAEGCTPILFDADPDEPILVSRVPLAEIPGMLEPGETRINQAQAMIGLLWLLRIRGM